MRAPTPDTPANQKAYPQQSAQKPGCGFPILRLLAFLSLSSGLLTAWATGHWRQSEVALLQTLWDHLRAGDVLLGDRGFCNWGLLAECLGRDLHAVFRVKGARRRDFRQGQRLSRDERLVQWKKPAYCGVTFSAAQWAALPDLLTLRLVRCRLEVAGFRTRKVILVTTLLDSVTYPPAALGQLYYRRWAMELVFKRFKSLLKGGHVPKTNDTSALAWMQAKMLVSLLLERILLEGHFLTPGEPCRDEISRWRIVLEVRDCLARVLAPPLSLPHLLERGRAIASASRAGRPKRPLQMTQIRKLFATVQLNEPFHIMNKLG